MLIVLPILSIALSAYSGSKPPDLNGSWATIYNLEMKTAVQTYTFYSEESKFTDKAVYCLDSICSNWDSQEVSKFKYKTTYNHELSKKHDLHIFTMNYEDKESSNWSKMLVMPKEGGFFATVHPDSSDKKIVESVKKGTLFTRLNSTVPKKTLAKLTSNYIRKNSISNPENFRSSNDKSVINNAIASELLAPLNFEEVWGAYKTYNGSWMDDFFYNDPISFRAKELTISGKISEMNGNEMIIKLNTRDGVLNYHIFYDDIKTVSKLNNYPELPVKVGVQLLIAGQYIGYYKNPTSAGSIPKILAKYISVYPR